MPAPGLTADECRAALLHLLNAARDVAATDEKKEILRLSDQLDREIAVRATVEGQSRMSVPEALVFEPTVRRLRILLQATRGGSMGPREIGAALSSVAEAGLTRLNELSTH